MRGSLVISFANLSFDGIIPADAGLTAGKSRWTQMIGDHPRGCGAHDQTSGVARQWEGSSPRMRDSQLTFIAVCQEHGIIPADAGLTLS